MAAFAGPRTAEHQSHRGRMFGQFCATVLFAEKFDDCRHCRLWLFFHQPVP
jgi:hypothetical protein